MAALSVLICLAVLRMGATGVEEEEEKEEAVVAEEAENVDDASGSFLTGIGRYDLSGDCCCR